MYAPQLREKALEGQEKRILVVCLLETNLIPWEMQSEMAQARKKVTAGGYILSTQIKAFKKIFCKEKSGNHTKVAK